MASSVTTTLFENLFTLYASLGVAVTLVVFGWFVYLLVKYRSRSTTGEQLNPTGNEGLATDRGGTRAAIVITAVIAVILFALAAGTFNTVVSIETPPKEAALEVKVVAFTWGWRFVYPNGFESTGELRVPADRPVVLTTSSIDVFHSFGIPDLRIKADAIPGQQNRIWIQVFEPGEHAIRCFELCGLGHALMLGKIVVLKPTDFDRWYAGLQPKVRP